MAEIATTAAGNVVILKDGKWVPADVAQNPQGDKVYHDGSAWLPVPKAQAQPPARPQSSQPSQPWAHQPGQEFSLDRDWGGGAQRMLQDVQSTYHEGLGNIAQSGVNIGQAGSDLLHGRFGSAASNIGGAAIRAPVGAMQSLGAIAAPLFRPFDEQIAHPAGESVRGATKPYLGEAGSRFAGGATEGTLNLIPGMALGPEMGMRGETPRVRPPERGALDRLGPDTRSIAPAEGERPAPVTEGEHQVRAQEVSLWKRGGWKDLRSRAGWHDVTRNEKAAPLPEWFDHVTSAVHDLAKKMGIEGKIAVYAGEHGVAFGSTHPTGIIAIRSDLSAEHALGTAIHEFGHQVDLQLVKKANPETKAALEEAWKEFWTKHYHSDKTVGHFIPLSIGQSEFGKTRLRDTSFDYKNSYILGRQEWFAEQASRWLTQNEKPRSVVDRFFKNVADHWKKLYEHYVGYVPLSSEVENFMKGHWRDDVNLPMRTPGERPYETTGGKTQLSAAQVSAPRGAPPPTTPPSPPTGGGNAPRQRPPKPSTPPSSRMGSWFEKVFSPTTINDLSRRAERTIRQAGGRQLRDTETSNAKLARYDRVVAGMGQNSRMQLLHYMESRSGGAKLGLGPEEQALADALRNEFEARRRKMEALPHFAGMSFVQDFFPHLWKDQAKAKTFVEGWIAKQGSGGFTKARTFPTIADGLAAGLELATDDPIEAGMRYIDNADRFIAQAEILDRARSGPATSRDVKYFTPGRAPQGWVPLKGRMAQRANMVAHAPEGWARVYNRAVDSGLQGEGLARGAMNTVQRTANFTTGWELGLSAVHLRNMVFASWNSEFARAAGAIRAGKPLKALGVAVKAPFAPILLPIRGARGQSVYLGMSRGTARQARIVNEGMNANARFTKLEKNYLASREKSFITLFRRGELFAEAGRDWAKFSRAPGALGPTKEAGKIFAKNLARTMDLVMHPLFQQYIPKLKAGALMEHIGDWLEANPHASAEELQTAMQNISDSMDNRFGEMNTDNIFWNKAWKQAAQSAMVSYSWNMGKVREIMGGAADVARGRPSIRSDYIVGMAMTYSLFGTAYLYLKTGKFPDDKDVQSFLRDVLTPQTGGVDRQGDTERLAPQGDMKEIFGWLTNDPMQEAENKLNPAMHTAIDVLRNRDYKNDPVAPGSSTEEFLSPEWIKAYLDYLGGSIITPASITSQQNRQPGTGISRAETFLGLNPANRGLTNPQDASETNQYFQEKAWQRKKRHDEQYKGPQ